MKSSTHSAAVRLNMLRHLTHRPALAIIMKVLTPIDAARSAVAPNSSRPATAVLLDTPDARLVVFRLAPGQSVPSHKNASTVLLTVLSGSGFLTGERDGQPDERECSAGDVIAYAPHESHAMRAGESELMLLATITPRPGERNAER